MLPQGKRRKILFEHRPFPSDHYVFESQARLHGHDPSEVLVEMQPREGEWNLRTEDIVAKIEELGDELACVCFGGVNYFTGQFFDLPAIVAAAHRAGATCGFDLAHAAGNLVLHLHDWNADFACWCSYKYLNSGPGGVAGAFVHQRHHADRQLLRLAGWWGHNKDTRFRMEPGFDPIPTAEGWQLSNAPILSMAAHRAALELFDQAGMMRLREKSIQLTAYLEFVLGEVRSRTGVPLEIITPSDPHARGCQLSVVVPGSDRSLVDKLQQRGVVADWREPDVIRMAPVPMYNSFEDVLSFGEIFTSIL
jgi:kynureninase